MKSTFATPVAISLAALLLLAPCARTMAQGEPAPPTTVPPVQPAQPTPHLLRSPTTLGAPTQVAPTNRALLQLARERAALELVQSSAQRALLDATHRIAAMHAFIESSGASAAFARFSQTYQPLGGQITFHEATDLALDHLASRPARPGCTDLQQLEQAVQAQSGAALQAFSQLNAARRAVEVLATFLQRAGTLHAYQQWAAAHPATQAKQTQPLADPGAIAAAHDTRALQLGWDRAQVAQMQQYPPTLEPGKAVAHGPYATTWWNSYADPYYDISGAAPGNAQPSGDWEHDEAPGWSTPGYGRSMRPWYPELGPNVVPAFGMFPSGAAGGASFGPGAGVR